MPERYSQIQQPCPPGLSFGKGSTLEQSWVEWPVGAAVASFGPLTRLHQCQISLGAGARLEVGAGCKLMGRIIVSEGATLRIGDGLVCNNNAMRVQVAEGGEVRIGDNCLFADPKIFNSDMHAIFDAESGQRCNGARDVIIGDRVWLATGTIILKGARLSRDTVVGAGAVVQGQHPPSCVLAGNPARVVKRGISWSRNLLDRQPLRFDDDFSDARLRASAAEYDHAAVLAMALKHWPLRSRMDIENCHVFYYLGRAIFELHFRPQARSFVVLDGMEISLSDLARGFERVTEHQPSNLISAAYACLIARMEGRDEDAARLHARVHPAWPGAEAFLARLPWTLSDRAEPPAPTSASGSATQAVTAAG